MNEDRGSRGFERSRPWVDVAMMVLAAISLAQHTRLLPRTLAAVVTVLFGADLVRLVLAHFRRAKSATALTDRRGGGEAEADADIVLTPGDRGEWIISPDLDSGDVEVELLIRGRRYLALLHEGESSAYEEAIRRIADELDAGTPEVNVNSAFLATLGREPFFGYK